MGSVALANNTTGCYNIGMNNGALYYNTTGKHNIALGRNSLGSNSVGCYNIALGQESLFFNTSSSLNVAIGKQALSKNTTGKNNTSIGYRALCANTTGNTNIAFGYKTNSAISSGNNNIVIGTNIGVAESSINKINIGALIFGSGSYANSGSAVFSGSANGFIGINQPNPQYNLDISGSGNFTNSLTVTGSLRGQVSTLSIASNTASVNMSSNNFFTLTLANGTGTNINPTNINPGQTVNIRVTQGSAGTGTVTFPSLVKQASGSLYTGSAVANAVDIVTMVAFDSSTVYVSSVRNMI